MCRVCDSKLPASNSLELYKFIFSMEGETFTERAKAAVQKFDEQISGIESLSVSKHQLLKIKGLVESLIKFDKDMPVEINWDDARTHVS